MTIRIYGATGLAMATGWQTIAVIFRQTVGGSIQVETIEQQSGWKQRRQQSEWKQWAKLGPAIGGSNQVAGCDRWVTN